jgi:hypothetical protein
MNKSHKGIRNCYFLFISVMIYIKKSKKATNTFIISNYFFTFAQNLDYYVF